MSELSERTGARTSLPLADALTAAQAATDPRAVYVIALSSIAAIGGFLFGFDSGVINGTVDALAQAFGTRAATAGFAAADGDRAGAVRRLLEQRHHRQIRRRSQRDPLAGTAGLAVDVLDGSRAVARVPRRRAPHSGVAALPRRQQQEGRSAPRVR